MRLRPRSRVYPFWPPPGSLIPHNFQWVSSRFRFPHPYPLMGAGRWYCFLRKRHIQLWCRNVGGPIQRCSLGRHNDTRLQGRSSSDRRTFPRWSSWSNASLLGQRAWEPSQGQWDPGPFGILTSPGEGLRVRNSNTMLRSKIVLRFVNPHKSLRCSYSPFMSVPALAYATLQNRQGMESPGWRSARTGNISERRWLLSQLALKLFWESR